MKNHYNDYICFGIQMIILNEKSLYLNCILIIAAVHSKWKFASQPVLLPVKFLPNDCSVMLKIVSGIGIAALR